MDISYLPKNIFIDFAQLCQLTFQEANTAENNPSETWKAEMTDSST